MATDIGTGELTHRFIEALNARRRGELEQLVAHDAEFTTPRRGGAA